VNLVRVVGVLLWHNGEIVQTENFGITNRIHHDPIHAVEVIESSDLDELAIINITKNVASKKAFHADISQLTKVLRIPLICGGLIESIEDCNSLLRNGADKLMINTALIRSPDFVTEAVRQFGSSTMVASIDLASSAHSNFGQVKIFENRSGVASKLCLDELLNLVRTLKVGEIFFNNVRHDGARIGYDLEGLRYVFARTDVPVIAFGGVSNWRHLVEAIDIGISAVAFGNALHYIETAPRKAKKFLRSQGKEVRYED